MAKRPKPPTTTELLATIGTALELLVGSHQERITELENRVAALEAKSRALRNRAPIREIENGLRDLGFRVYKLSRAMGVRTQPPPSGSAADN